MESLNKDLPVHISRILIQRTSMLQVRSEILVNNKPFETELTPTDEARLVKYWDAGKGLKSHYYGQTSAKVIFVDRKFYTYAGPADLQDLFINIAEQWLASGTST